MADFGLTCTPAQLVVAKTVENRARSSPRWSPLLLLLIVIVIIIISVIVNLAQAIVYPRWRAGLNHRLEY